MFINTKVKIRTMNAQQYKSQKKERKELILTNTKVKTTTMHILKYKSKNHNNECSIIQN